MVLLDDPILTSAHLSENEVRLELAIALYQQARLTQRQAALLAHLSDEDFDSILAKRNVSHPFNESDLAIDIATLKTLRDQRDRHK